MLDQEQLHSGEPEIWYKKNYARMSAIDLLLLPIMPHIFLCVFLARWLHDGIVVFLTFGAFFTAFIFVPTVGTAIANNGFHPIIAYGFSFYMFGLPCIVFYRIVNRRLDTPGKPKRQTQK
jgi:hypothetical protein